MDFFYAASLRDRILLSSVTPVEFSFAFGCFASGDDSYYVIRFSIAVADHQNPVSPESMNYSAQLSGGNIEEFAGEYRDKKDGDSDARRNDIGFVAIQ